MGGTCSALHVNTGEPGAAAAIDAWLAKHHVEVHTCDDAYSALVHLIRQRGQPSQLAIVGMDWLATDEVEVVGYVRAAWPDAVIVVYSADETTVPNELAGVARVVRSADELQALLVAPPQALLPAAPADDPLAVSARPLGPRAHELLTAEELAALLGEDDA